MEMYYLVLLLWSEPVVMPEKYNLQQCDEIGKTEYAYRCIAAPKERCHLEPLPNLSSGNTVGVMKCEN